MGVTGLWEIIQHSSTIVPLTQLSLEAFERSTHASSSATSSPFSPAGPSRERSKILGIAERYLEDENDGSSSLSDDGHENRSSHQNSKLGKSVNRATPSRCPNKTRRYLDRISPSLPNPRALRLGIDAPLWLFHARVVPGGSNPLLRTIFFRLLKLMRHPILPLFVFDGPDKPKFKRGHAVMGVYGRDRDSLKVKAMLDMMGIEWIDAPGEAEAELAHLSREGLLDAVLTDDVDTLIFGATIVLRNPSKTLSSNVSRHATRSDAETREEYQLFRSCDLEIDRDGFILMALLCGGDYHAAGLAGCGPKIALGLAHVGFGSRLMKAYRSKSSLQFQDWLPLFRQELRDELCTNKSGQLPSKRKALAESLPDSFPDIEILRSYADPLVGSGWKGFGIPGKRGHPKGYARACEAFFEWATKEEVARRMRTSAWKGEIVGQLREELLEQDDELLEIRRSFPPFILLKITRNRQHASTGSELEYYVEYETGEWTKTIQEAMEGRVKHQPTGQNSEFDSDSSLTSASSVMDTPRRQKRDVDVFAPLKDWIPARLLQPRHKDLIKAFEAAEAEKALRRTPKKARESAKNTNGQLKLSSFFTGAKTAMSSPTRNRKADLPLPSSKLPPKKTSNNARPRGRIDKEDHEEEEESEEEEEEEEILDQENAYDRREREVTPTPARPLATKGRSLKTTSVGNQTSEVEVLEVSSSPDFGARTSKTTRRAIISSQTISISSTPETQPRGGKDRPSGKTKAEAIDLTTTDEDEETTPKKLPSHAKDQQRRLASDVRDRAKSRDGSRRSLPVVVDSP